MALLAMGRVRRLGKRVAFGLIAGGWLSACSSSTTADGDSGTSTAGASGSGVVHGTFQGQTLTVADVIAAKGIDDPSAPYQVSIVFGSAPGLCPFLQSALAGPPANKANTSLLILVFTPTDPSGALTPGTYSPGAHTLSGTYETFDANCVSVPPHAGTSSGTATIISVGAAVSGTFDIMFGTDHVTGSFDAPVCAVPPRGDAATGDGGIRCLQ